MKKIRQFFTENIVLKLCSLVIAFLLWLIVVSIDNPVMYLTYSGIPVTVENAQLMEENGKAFQIAENNRTVSIVVRAERSVLNQLSRDNFLASINMAYLDGNLVPLELKATRYADRIRSITSRTENIRVEVEDLVQKQISVKAVTTGEPAEGYRIGSVKAASNVVRMSGPESIVNSIVRAEVSVVVTGMTSNIRANEAIVFYDENDDPVDTSELELSIERTIVTVEIWGTKEVPVVINYTGVPADGYATNGVVKASLDSVLVTGEEKALSSLEEVEIPASRVDITGASETVEEVVNLTMYLPDGVYVDDEEQATVTVTVGIEQLQTTVVNIPTVNISFENVPEGMIALFADDSVETAVSIRGLTQSVLSLNPVEVTGKVDLSQIPLAEGQLRPEPDLYNCEVSFTYPPGIYAGDVVVVKPVLLQINDAQPEIVPVPEELPEGM